MPDNTSNGYEQWSCKKREQEKYSLSEKDIRRWYQRDIDQITHSTGFRKLQQKSQLLSEKDPRSRSRMIHTIEVSRIATEISEKLNVSKELTEAICYAHDIATAPYGFIGNHYLLEKAKCDFTHEHAGALQLLKLTKKRVDEDDEDLIELIEEEISSSDDLPMANVKSSPFPLYVSKETNSSGNDEEIIFFVHHISPEIIDGVMNHGKNGYPNTIEGQIVQIADNIAYLSQDIEDLLSTKIISSRDFSQYANKTLKYKIDGNCVEKKWEDIDRSSFSSLKDAFNKTRGRRVAALVNRFVQYNLTALKEFEINKQYSTLLSKEIPVLKIDDGMKAVMDFIWYYIESKYNDSLIQTSNGIQRQKMEELWTILHDSRFVNKNQSFRDFMKELSSSSLFSSFSDEWKCAFFISHLSYTEVDLILDSFHERNFTFDLDIKEL